MTQICLQIGIRDQAGRIGRMIDSRLPAQDIKSRFKNRLGLGVLPNALVGTRKVDA